MGRTTQWFLTQQIIDSRIRTKAKLIWFGSSRIKVLVLRFIILILTIYHIHLIKKITHLGVLGFWGRPRVLHAPSRLAGGTVRGRCHARAAWARAASARHVRKPQVGGHFRMLLFCVVIVVLHLHPSLTQSSEFIWDMTRSNVLCQKWENLLKTRGLKHWCYCK